MVTIFSPLELCHASHCESALLAAAVLSHATLVQAQEKAKGIIELGVDAFVGQVKHRTITSTVADLPFKSARLGIYVSDRIELEPSMSIEHVKHSDFEYGYTNMKVPIQERLFFRAAAELSRIKPSNNDASTRRGGLLGPSVLTR